MGPADQKKFPAKFPSKVEKRVWKLFQWANLFSWGKKKKKS